MEKALGIGMSVTEMNIQGALVKGNLEKVLERTVIVRDEKLETHLMSIESLQKKGISLPYALKKHHTFKLPTRL